MAQQALRDDALSTVDAVKDDLGILHNNDDLFIEREINKATGIAQGYTHRQLKYDESDGKTVGVYTPATTPYQCLLDGNGTPELFLRQMPVQSIQLVRARTTFAGSWTTIDAGDYVLYADEGIIVLASAVLAVSGVWTKGHQTVEITFKAGYDYVNNELPYTIQSYVSRCVAWGYYSRRRDPMVKSENLAAVYSYSLKDVDPQWGIPREILMLLDAERKFRV